MTKKPKTLAPHGKNLRSQLWFDNPDNPGMTAIYLERYLNYGLTGPELRSGKPIAETAIDKVFILPSRLSGARNRARPRCVAF